MTHILSWNVNGIRAVEKKGLLEWIPVVSPDIFCIQETKALHTELDPKFFEVTHSGGKYFSYWASSTLRKGYSGVAIYSKREPLSVCNLGIEEFDAEGRVLIADYGDFNLICAYFPNSQDAGARIDYKIRFCEAILAVCDAIVKKGGNVILAGDYNIAHEPIDLENPKTNEGNAGYLPEERAWFSKFVAAGYVDIFRKRHPEPRQYTWWSYRMPSVRERNIGWRIDYQCVNSNFESAVLEATIHPEVLGSDHCPVGLKLKI